MQVQVTRFSEEAINNFLVAYASRFSDYEYVHYVKGKAGITPKQSLDIIVLLEKNKDKYNGLYDSLNYRLSQSNNIPTFFRSADKNAFMFPGGINIHFVDLKKVKELIYKWNIIGGVADKELISLLFNKMKKIDGINSFLVLEDNAFYNWDKAQSNFWNQKPQAKSLGEY